MKADTIFQNKIMIVSVILIGVILTAMLVGCNNGNNSIDGSSAVTSSANTVKETSDIPALATSNQRHFDSPQRRF